MRKHPCGDIVIQHLPFVENDDPAGIVRHILHAVRNQHNGNAGLLVQLFQHPQNVIPPLRIQTCSRFIQHQNLRVHRQDPGDRNPSLLPAGQLKWRLVLVALVKSDHAHRCPCAPSCLFFGKSLILRSETDILQHRCLKDLVFRVLEHQTDPEPELPHRVSVLIDLLSIDKNLPGRSPVQPVQMLNQRRFSRTRMADDPDELPAPDGQADVIERLFLVRGSQAVYVIKMLDSDLHA